MAKRGRQRGQRGQSGQGGAQGQGRQTRQEMRRVAAERAAQRRAAEQAAQRRRLIAIGGAIAVAVVIAAVLIIVNWPEDNENEPVSLPAIVAQGTPYPGVPAETRFLGDPNAPVTLVEYGDYQCPFCGQFARDSEHLLVQEYVATGQVRYEFRPLAFLDDRSDDNESDRAAEATLCAGDQGQFWQMHDTLYFNQNGENQGAFSEERVGEMAQQLGLNMDQFNACVGGETHKAELDATAASASEQGVNSTPTFLINGQIAQASASYDDLKAKLDAAIAAATPAA